MPRESVGEIIRTIMRMLRLVPLAWIVVCGCSVRAQPPQIVSQGIALHFAENAPTAALVADRLAGSGAEPVCQDRDDRDCMEITGAGASGIVRVRPPALRSGDEAVRSVGAAFDEAYALGERSGARRAEPLLRVEIPRARAAPGRDSLGLGSRGDSDHDPRAASDPTWSLKHVRAEEAWKAIRDETGRPVGKEAEGIVIAQPDTGYLEHGEIWSEDGSSSPMWPEKGYDYFDSDDDATDELLDDDLLDNPAHGTGAASTIASPAGCQIPQTDKCPTGPAAGARLVPLRVGRSVVILDTERVSSAIRDASGSDRSRVKTDTQVMSISMGGVPSWTLWKAVKSAEERGYLLVAAAGNYVGKVVWPARFPSVVAVAATNAGCRPWAFTSFGPAVDVSAPGESVWRASLEEDGSPSAGMGKGTTFSAATVAGVAALWLAYHGGSEELRALRERGELTRAFLTLLQSSAWKPGSGASPVSCDEGIEWDDSLYGSGIADARALLRAPVEGLVLPRTLSPRRLEELPLWTSLYPEETAVSVVIDDYRRLFGLSESEETEPVAIFETEILHHYATSDAVSSAIDAVVIDGERGDEDFARIVEALRARDLSTRLRAALP